MSHYCCAIFADSPKDFIRLLKPYDEANEAYFSFIPVEKERLLKNYETFLSDNNPYREQGYSFDQYLTDYHYVQREDGSFGYYANPDGKWDWYTLSGREDFFEFKPDCGYDSDGNIKKSAIDFFLRDEEEIKDDAEFWDREAEEPNSCYVDHYGTKDNYLKYSGRAIPYAYITPDGVWHAPGNVGWFGMSDETFEEYDAYVQEFDKFVSEAPDCYVNFADLHI